MLFFHCDCMIFNETQYLKPFKATSPCIYFCRYTKMKTATNIYIFNLALADALATSTLPFQSAKYLMNTWPFGEPLCKLVIAIDYYNMFTSIFTLTMMSVDRYIAVCHPVRALEFRTPVKAKFINVCVWILSSAIGVPIMVMAVTKVTDQGECFYKLFMYILWQNISGHLTITLKHGSSLCFAVATKLSSMTYNLQFFFTGTKRSKSCFSMTVPLCTK